MISRRQGVDIKVAENEMTDFKVADNWPRNKLAWNIFRDAIKILLYLEYT